MATVTSWCLKDSIWGLNAKCYAILVWTKFPRIWAFCLILGSRFTIEGDQQSLFRYKHRESWREACWKNCNRIIWWWCAPNSREFSCFMYRLCCFIGWACAFISIVCSFLLHFLPLFYFSFSYNYFLFGILIRWEGLWLQRFCISSCYQRFHDPRRGLW